MSRLSPSVGTLLLPLMLYLVAEFAPAWMHPKVVSALQNAAFVLFVIFLLRLVRQAALIAIQWGQLHANHLSAIPAMEKGFVPLMRNIITLLVFFMGAIMLLKHFGYDAMSLITALGVGSLAVGLAAKDTLSNMISGFTLIIDRNLQPGDRVTHAGSTGVVEEIGLRSTRINLGDGNTLIVPNAELVNTRIINLTMNAHEATCSTRIRVGFSIPFEKVRAICLEEAAQLPHLRSSFTPSVALVAIQEGVQLISITVGIRRPEAAGDILTELHDRLLKRFARENIPLVGSTPAAPPA